MRGYNSRNINPIGGIVINSYTGAGVSTSGYSNYSSSNNIPNRF